MSIDDNADWLFPHAAGQKAAQEEKGLAWAQKYLVFVQDPRARELLEHWTKTERRRSLPPNASAQEYAYYNARRDIFEGIHAEIEFAQNGLNQPRARTTNA